MPTQQNQPSELTQKIIALGKSAMRFDNCTFAKNVSPEAQQNVEFKFGLKYIQFMDYSNTFLEGNKAQHVVMSNVIQGALESRNQPGSLYANFQSIGWYRNLSDNEEFRTALQTQQQNHESLLLNAAHKAEHNTEVTSEVDNSALGQFRTYMQGLDGISSPDEHNTVLSGDFCNDYIDEGARQSPNGDPSSAVSDPSNASSP
jgi:hypothetical protein